MPSAKYREYRDDYLHKRYPGLRRERREGRRRDSWRYMVVKRKARIAETQ